MRKSDIIDRLKLEFNYSDERAEEDFKEFFPWAFKNRKTIDDMVEEIKNSESSDYEFQSAPVNPVTAMEIDYQGSMGAGTRQII